MTLSAVAAALTGEGMFGKDTSGRPRPRPSRDQIARLAYRIYEARGRRDGHELDDWLSAERALVYHYRYPAAPIFDVGGCSLTDMDLD